MSSFFLYLFVNSLCLPLFICFFIVSSFVDHVVCSTTYFVMCIYLFLHVLIYYIIVLFLHFFH